MAIDHKIICPMLQRQCIEDGALVNGELHACRFWVHLYGQDPQTGATRDVWDCAFAWQPVLLIENSARQRETAAELEKLRKELIPQNQAMNGIAAQMVGLLMPARAMKIIDDDGTESAAH